MNFNESSQVEQTCWQMRYADVSRGLNRARINALFNGGPPYTTQEVQENGIIFNINDLSSTRLAHDARSQFYGAFCKPGNYFTCRTDKGGAHKKDIYSTVVTKEINRIMKRSLEYFEKVRSTFASDVLHGIGPGAWRDPDYWCPDPIGIEDVLIPANTLLHMRNLPFFAVCRSLTAPELIRMTRGPDVDEGWNMPLVNACIDWIDKETMALMGTNWPEVWAPEKIEERKKGDGGFYVGDNVPTINVFDFYFWNDNKKEEGWNRRMVLDSWSQPQTTGAMPTRQTGEIYNRNKSEFLFNSKTRKYASRREELITFQFADLSSTAPFRYHSVRSLGFMLFAVCHVQNRMRCKINEAMWENMTMLFKVRSQEEGQRALKVNMFNRGFIDESLQFIPAAERFQINAALVELGLAENQRLIESNSNSYTQNRSPMADKREKTATQVMAEVNAMTSLVSAALMQAYRYQEVEDREIFRRFCKLDSQDPDVRTFQANIVRQGVPLKCLNPEAWDIEHDKVMGAGNKTLEMAISQQLLEIYDKLDPEPQRSVLRKVIMSSTDDAGLALSLVPESPVKITDSVHDAQLAAGTLMQGLPVALKTGMNHIEYVEALLASLAILVDKAQKTGQVTPQSIEGLTNIANHIGEHIKIIAQDQQEAARVRKYMDQLTQVMGLVQQLAAEMQKHMAQQNGNGQVDPEKLQKLQAQQAMDAAKVQNTRESHAQKTVQRQLQFEQQMAQDAEQAKLDISKKVAETNIDLEREKIKNQMKKQQKPKKE